MMIAIKVEYEGESVNVALYEGIEVEEFTEVILNSMRINGTILGLKDVNGVILLPKYICQNVANIQQNTYELVVKPKDPRSATSTVSRKPEPNKSITYSGSQMASPSEAESLVKSRKANEVIPEQDFMQMIKYLKLDGFLTEQEERAIYELYRSNNTDLISLHQQYQK